MTKKEILNCMGAKNDKPKSRTRFKCQVCGKISSGRMPKQDGIKGDGSARFPRRHKVNGIYCEGNHEEAEWVDCL